MTTSLVEQERLLARRLPGWRRWLFGATIAWAIAFTALRVSVVLAGRGAPPTGDGLALVPGWWSVALGCAAALVVLGQRRSPGSRWWAVAGWAVATCLVGASALLLLDVVGILLPGLGVGVDLAAAGSRSACLGGGLLVLAHTVAHDRLRRGVCPACGRRPGQSPTSRNDVPLWARAAAGVAIAGCLIRLVAQVLVGLDDELLRGSPAVVLFEAGFLLAGTILPLALVCRWGRTFPAWLPGFGGRTVPRRLVLVPALGLGVGMTAYFGLTLVMITAQAFTGTWPDGGGLPVWFFWVAVPAYLVWGVGLGIGGLAYGRATRPSCRVCAADEPGPGPAEAPVSA